MTNQPSSPDDMNKALFLNLVTMLSMSAMQQLGKLKNPFTGKTEVHFDMAQATIDMLDMLEAKTRGHRDTDEEKVLKDTLTMLKMNYVETQEQQKTEPQRSEPQRSEPQKSEIKDQQEDKKTEGQGDKEPRGQGESQAQGNERGKPETKDPKFHKSYS